MNAATLFRRLQDGRVRPVIAEEFPLLRAAQAGALLESGEVFGNLVQLTPEVRIRPEKRPLLRGRDTMTSRRGRPGSGAETLMVCPRVLLADDHVLVAEGIRKLLEPRFDVLGTVADGRALLVEAETLQPDAIVIDVSMPLLNGIDAAKKLRKAVPQAKILFLSMHADPLYVAEAFQAGGAGYVLKRSAGSELVFALEEVLKGRYYVTPAVARDVLRPLFEEDSGVRAKPPSSEPPRLTPRQREVLQLVAEGKSIKEIANVLEISVKTVEFHKSRIMEALDLRTTADLTKYAVAHGIASLEPQ